MATRQSMGANTRIPLLNRNTTTEAAAASIVNVRNWHSTQSCAHVAVAAI